MNIVYLTTNLINGKQYVGSHCTDIEDGYIGSGFALITSIKKYGKNNFERKILESCEDLNDARKLEEYYIEKYNTLSPNGYNISPTGGMGNFGRHSEESKIKLSLSLKNFWKNLSEDEKNKIILSKFKGKTYEEICGIEKAIKLKEKRREIFNKHNPMKGKFGIENPNFGSKRTDETKKKISESNKDKPKSEKHKISLSKAWEKRKIEFPVSDETKEKMSKTSKGKINIKLFKVIDPNGVEYITINGLSKFCEDHNLTVTLLHKVAMGKRNHHKNWKCYKIE
jgi:group I intron endonuclease